MERREFLGVVAASATGISGGCSVIPHNIPVIIEIRNTTNTQYTLQFEIRLAEADKLLARQTISVAPSETDGTYRLRLNLGELEQGTKLDIGYRVNDFLDSEPVWLDCSRGTAKTVHLRIMGDVVVDLGESC